jgi:CubicO group peptidase (beta-lactamase class C family)
MTTLPPLPPQSPDVPWPTERWPEQEPDTEVDSARARELVSEVFDDAQRDAYGETLALAVVHRGRLVFERYGDEHGPDESFISWSMAKSVTHALAGLLVARGKLELEAPAPVPEWRGAGDPRGAITLEHLLRMLDGLDFLEDYVDGEVSNVIEMLFGSGKPDVAGYAAARPPAHAPGQFWSYSSGTSNIVARIVGEALGGGEAATLAFMRRRLFEPIGMRSATPRFDEAGTFIGSSFVYATARDFARFGLLYLRDGVWGPGGERLLPEGWIDHARSETPASQGEYGAHWWLGLCGPDTFHASGYNGQYVVVSPLRDLVLVRLGLSGPEQREQLAPLLRELLEAFPER